MAEASYTSMTSMTSMTSSTVTQLGQEQRWEQQVIGVKEVRAGPPGMGGPYHHLVVVWPREQSEKPGGRMVLDPLFKNIIKKKKKKF